MFLFALLPFLKRKLTEFWSSRCLENQMDAQKDTFYRFIHHERFNWRNLVYFIALKVIAHGDDSPLRQKVLIADDSIAAKTGKGIELISYHYDHKVGRWILCNCYLLLVYILGKRRLTWAVGPLFRDLAADQRLLIMAQSLWADVKELIIRSSDVLCYKIEPDTLFHFIDIIEDTIIRQARVASAKL